LEIEGKHAPDSSTSPFDDPRPTCLQPYACSSLYSDKPLPKSIIATFCPSSLKTNIKQSEVLHFGVRMAESHAKETERISFANPLNKNETSASNNIIFERKAIINEI
jgi:hypothetical protein